MKSNIEIYTEEELKALPKEQFIQNTDSYEVYYTEVGIPIKRGTLILYGPNKYSHIEAAKKARKILKGKNIYIDSVNYL